MSYPDVKGPWMRLNIDLIGPLIPTDSGNRYILTVIDVFTKFAVATPLTDKSAGTVARAFVDNVICRYGAPLEVISDQGSEFIA